VTWTCPAAARFPQRTARRPLGEPVSWAAALADPYDDATYTRLLSASADATAWRIVELGSDSDRPFRAHLSWFGGDSPTPAEARLSVARRARVCLYAKRLDVHVQNVTNAPNTVSAFVQDSAVAVPTANTLEVWFDGAAFIPIPPFATRVRVDRNALTPGEGFFLLALPPPDAADPTVAPVGFGAAAFTLDLDQHPGAVPVHGAAAVQVLTTHPGRVVFDLAL